MATHALTPTQLKLGEHRLPCSTLALRARRRSQTRRRSWMDALRSWWPERPRQVPCDLCKRSMFEFQQVGTERLCIRCVADGQAALATPALAGAMAVLRALWLESEIERQAQRERPFVDSRRSDAVRETAEVVLWWLTPRDLRPPGTKAVGENTALEALATFDRVWALRCSTRKLADIYACWVTHQAKALRRAELSVLDRRYRALIGAEMARK
jgi:predicted outer membrane lipoprotein